MIFYFWYRIAAMDQLKQIEAFVNSATRGSLSAAARVEGVTPAVIGRRLDALEARLGVKLLLRTTRRLSLTFEGQSFLEECQRILTDLVNAETAVSLGGLRVSGHLKISAPAGFGRKHVVPLVESYMHEHPELRITLDLSDRLDDLLNEVLTQQCLSNAAEPFRRHQSVRKYQAELAVVAQKPQVLGEEEQICASIEKRGQGT